MRPCCEKANPHPIDQPLDIISMNTIPVHQALNDGVIQHIVEGRFNARLVPRFIEGMELFCVRTTLGQGNLTLNDWDIRQKDWEGENPFARDRYGKFLKQFLVFF